MAKSPFTLISLQGPGSDFVPNDGFFSNQPGAFVVLAGIIENHLPKRLSLGTLNPGDAPAIALKHEVKQP